MSVIICPFVCVQFDAVFIDEEQSDSGWFTELLYDYW